MTELNHTHDPAARSWIASANSAGCDFPIQNLPFAVFRRAWSAEEFRGGVAIGDQIVDLDALSQLGSLEGLARDALGACRQAQLNDFFAMGAPAWRALRHALFGLLHSLDADRLPWARIEHWDFRPAGAQSVGPGAARGRIGAEVCPLRAARL